MSEIHPKEANSPIVKVEQRPRRSTVLSPRYWNNGNSTTCDTSVDPTSEADENSDIDEETESDASEIDESDEELDEKFNEYLQNRTRKDAETDALLKEEQVLTRERLSKMGTENSQPARNRDTEIETYFKAILRPKYRKAKSKEEKKTLTNAKSGAERGCKPRKGNRTGLSANDKLPEKPEQTFSVSKEIRSLDPEVQPNFSSSCEKAMAQRFEEIGKDFPEWMFLMKEGFNIMIHGYGSKEQVFQNFKSYLNEEYLVIYINGQFPRKLSARQFIVDFCRAAHISIKITGTNGQLIAEEVRKKLEAKAHSRIFFLVRNCEMLANKNLPLFQAICVLTQVRSVHLIASCDHVNSFVGIDLPSLIALNFWWILCPTFAPYEDELSNLPGVLGQDSDKNNMKNSLQHILKSLTANAKKAFSLLATLQLSAKAAKTKDTLTKRKQEKEFEGIPFRELARRCQQNFIAHSDQTLSSLLVEFVDHHLITYSGKRGSMDSLSIKLDDATLEEFIKSHKV